jgi:hypothetical protein
MGAPLAAAAPRKADIAARPKPATREKADAGAEKSALGPSSAGRDEAGEGEAAVVPPTDRTGPLVVPARARPEADPASTACSFTEAVCVHAATGVHPAEILAALDDAEQALRAYRALGMPPPLSDEALGGSSAFDVYVVPGAEPPATTRDLVARAAPFDSASAFAVVPPRGPGAGCAPGFEVAQAVAEAVLARLDAGAGDGETAMTSSYLAELAAPCSVVAIEAVDDAQRTPERALTSGRRGRPDGQMLFGQWLDEAHGTGRPAGVSTALFDVSTQRTKPGRLRFDNEPDIFDALRLAAKDRKESAGEWLLDYSVTRAFLGSRNDGAHLADAERFGDLGRVRFEWNVPYASLPRRLAPLRPIEPTGATYLWLDLADAPVDGEITFVADWELPVLFRWALLEIDQNGVERGRFDVAGIFGSHHVEKTIENVGGLAGLLVVGVNEGDISRSYPFDPDEGPFEPHGYTVTFYK